MLWLWCAQSRPKASLTGVKLRHLGKFLSKSVAAILLGSSGLGLGKRGLGKGLGKGLGRLE